MKDLGTITIETERLILRRFTEDDVQAAYHNWCSDPETVKYLTWPAHASEEVTRAVLRSWIESYEDPKFYQWAVTIKGAEGPVGSISAVRLDEETEAVEIGYCIGREYRNQGYMTEALKAIIRFFMYDVQAGRVSARHDTRNPASGRVMAKAGMHKEGILRRSGRNNAGIGDMVHYAVVRGDVIL